MDGCIIDCIERRDHCTGSLLWHTLSRFLFTVSWHGRAIHVGIPRNPTPPCLLLTVLHIGLLAYHRGYVLELGN